MAAYPSIGYTATIEPSEGRRLVIAFDGSPRIRDYQTEIWYDGTITHPLISSTDKDTILTFYTTNKDSWNTFTESVSSDVYDILLVNEPVCQHLAGDWWQVTTTWRGSKQ